MLNDMRWRQAGALVRRWRQSWGQVLTKGQQLPKRNRRAAPLRQLGRGLASTSSRRRQCSTAHSRKAAKAVETEADVAESQQLQGWPSREKDCIVHMGTQTQGGQQPSGHGAQPAQVR